VSRANDIATEFAAPPGTAGVLIATADAEPLNEPPAPAGEADDRDDPATAARLRSAADRSSEEDVVAVPAHETVPQLARAAAGAWLRAAGWTAGTSLRVSGHLRRLAADPNGAQQVLEEVAHEVREVARDFLGISALEAEVAEITPLLSSGLLRQGGATPEALRAQGAALLRAAADVGFDEGTHPAFARILTELSPDEARILRLLALEGPQPMVDVRAGNLIGSGTQLIAHALTMLGPQAGLRDRGRIGVYLANLVRLNLAVLSDDPLDGPVAYQVLEAQPDVLNTLRATPRARTTRRSVRLTPLGREFCAVCFPVDPPALPPPRP
jgi:hypothetical protein